MKISLRWLCDHIQGVSFNAVDVSHLIALFNAKVAEIEHVARVVVSVDAYEAVRPLDSRLAALVRTDSIVDDPSAAYLIVQDAGKYRWVTLLDLGLEKDGLVPALHISDADLSGGWRGAWEAEDIILDVDNKSLTHRPDMWGHRGFAREVAALLGKRLVNQEVFLGEASATGVASRTVLHGMQSACTGFATVPFTLDVCAASNVTAVSRFVKIDYRPRNAVVDLTNYVMADWGHPMHAYDSTTITGSELTVRFATQNEKLLLLDGSSVSLDAADLVIADSQGPVALAGIMGGALTAVSPQSRHLLLEAGCFHASTIRRTGARHKLRTESSQRFEKTLDNQQIISTLRRYALLARSWGMVDSHGMGAISCTLSPRDALVVEVSHAYIMNRIGISLTPSEVADLLRSIDFEVAYTVAGDDVVYSIGVPSYRSTKDISGPHDIVEEVARLYGFDAITPVLPSFVHRASSLQSVMRERAVKNYLVQAAGMQEQRNYAFYHEPLLECIGWKEDEYLTLQNPVSQDARRLIGSVMPQLLGNIMDNSADNEQCAFFEWATVWPAAEKIERKELGGVWYKKRGTFNFFDLKDVVNHVCHIANVTLEWEPMTDTDLYQWVSPRAAALLKHGNTVVGAFGEVHPVIVQKIGGLPESTAYGFVLDATLLQHTLAPRYTVGHMRKYQHSTIDLSVLVPRTSFVAALEKELKKCSGLIEEVRLIDFFEKKEWTDVRSVAFRILLSHPERTLTKEEVDGVRTTAIECLKVFGAQLRE